MPEVPGGAPWRRVLAAILVCGVPLLRLQAQGGLDAQALVGILAPTRPAIAMTQVRQKCVELAALPVDRIIGPHGDKLLAERCEVISFGPIEKAPSVWFAAHTRWTSEFTAEDLARGPSARDTIVEEEVVLFDTPRSGHVRPVWRERFETGPYAIYATITPEIALAGESATLFSVMRCVNGTGGCAQEFLLRRSDGRWAAVRQDWIQQLPAGYSGRIRHGTRIDPLTLVGESGFYGDADPNCCPGQILTVNLVLRGEALVLVGQSVAAAPQQ